MRRLSADLFAREGVADGLALESGSNGVDFTADSAAVGV
jgi:hypothetical protein